MNSRLNICRMCLQKCLGPTKILNNDPKTSRMVAHLFPDMGIGLVKTSNICEECSKFIQISYTMSQTIIKNEEKLNLNKALVCKIQNNTCRLCWTINEAETPVFLYEISGQTVPHLEARAIIKVSILNLDFDLFKKPVVCIACWNMVRSIYLFKKKCLAVEKIFYFYCTKNSVTSITNYDLEAVSKCYNATLQKVTKSELNPKYSSISRETECNIPKQMSSEEVSQSVEMSLIYSNSDSDDDKFEEEYNYISPLSSKTIKEEPIDKSLAGEIGNIEANNLGGDVMKDKIVEFVEEYPIIKETTFESSGKLGETSQSKLENIETFTIPTTVLELEVTKTQAKTVETSEKSIGEKNILKNSMNSSEVTNLEIVKLESLKKLSKHVEIFPTTKQSNKKFNRRANSKNRDKNNIKKQSEVESLKNNCGKMVQRLTNKLKNSSENIENIEMTNTKVDNCPSIGDTNPNTDNEVKRQKAKEKNRETEWSCPKCEFKTKYKNHLKRHSVQHENNGEFFDCTKCLYSTAIKRNLERHIKIHSYECLDGINDKNIKKVDKTEAFVEPVTFKCSKCPYSSSNEIQFLAHIRTHNSKGNILKCSKCHYITLRKYSLMNHMELHSFDPSSVKS